MGVKLQWSHAQPVRVSNAQLGWNLLDTYYKLVLSN